MDAILFVVLVAAVAVVGVGLGLVVAPRLTRWDERRNQVEAADPVDEGGVDDRE